MSRITRREFLGQSSGLFVGFSLFGVVGCSSVSRDSSLDPESPARVGPKTQNGSPAPGHVDSWLQINASDRVIIYTGYIDAGTGIKTAIEQIVADELGVEMSSVSSINGDTLLTPFVGISQASLGIATAGNTVRVAAAAARRALSELGAARLGVPVDKVVAENGRIVAEDGSQGSIGFGELIGDSQFHIELGVEDTWNGPALKTDADLKTSAHRTLVGKSVPRVDIPSKVFGDYEFVQNVRIPGMLHGRVVRPPDERQHELISIDEKSVAELPGVEICHKGNFIGVVAPREEIAIKAATALQVEWKLVGEELPVHEREKFAAVMNAPERRVETDVEIGNFERAIAAAKQKLHAMYYFGYQLHAMTGPSCALADVRSDGTATIWAGTQNPHGDRISAAEILGFETKDVRLIWRQASGGYGRLTFDDSVADATLLSSLSGRPVRVQWMRHEENSWEPISPAMVFDVQGGLDSDGNIIGMRHEQWSARHMLVTKGHLLAWRHSGEEPADGYAWGGNPPSPQYNIPNITIQRHVTEDIVRPMSLRTPGRVQSIFAFESMIDELAAAASEDPVGFRLRHLSDERAIAVIKSASERAGWEARPAGLRTTTKERYAGGRGIAYVEHYGGHLATVVNVLVDRQTGAVKVQNVWVAVDHGEIVNPDGLLNQTEGGTIQGISRSLFEDVIYEDSKRTNLDWVSYPVIRYKDIPEIDIHMINRPEVASVGAGEPSSAPLPAAIGNAIYDAIGVRLRTAPFLPERVKAALAG